MTATRADDDSAVLVVGAGIAGMAAAMHLAAVGRRVYLLDTAPSIGGSMHLLDHTFPTNSCGICLMLPQQPALCPTFECQRHEAITLLTYAEVIESREIGKQGFLVTVRHKTRLVDPARCDGCGACAAACPVARPHDHEGWHHPVKAIYRPAGQRIVPDAWLVDPAYCTRCGACVTACPRGAVDLDMPARDETLAVGAVLLTPGFAPFDARLKGEYGYGVYDNVLSSLEFERLVSLAGSGVAHLTRPSDGQVPGKVAFIQCVGSRDPLCGAGHCSSACCMYTAKQVALAKKLAPALGVTVFFMDLRAFGKDFEAYVAGVQALGGVSYRRAMPSAVHQLQHSRDLRLSYVGEDGKVREEDFGLVVLGLGFAPPPGAQALARALGVALNEQGFARSDGYLPARTGQAGVFVAGAFREPKDIPETVAEAAGAAAEVEAYLLAGRKGQVASRELQAASSELEPATGSLPLASRSLEDEEPRVGVFVCECGGALAGLDLPGLVGWAARQPGVAVAQVVPWGCAAEGRAAIAAAIAADRLNRVVVAGCSQRHHAPEFEALMHDAGLDPRLLARANLREQVALPHGGTGPGAAARAAKARALVAMAVAGQRHMAGLAALSRGGRPWPGGQARQVRRPGAVVVGGGAAGMSAALALAGQGIAVDLVERATELGGQWRHIRYQADGSDPQAALAAMVDRVRAEERIRVHLGAEVGEMHGAAGDYRSLIVGGEGRETVSHGAVVVATGGREAAVREYLRGGGQDPRVLTQRELEQQVADGTLATVRRVVMIQCVGSREAERPYCSRVCCTQAVKNALKLKALRPGVEVYVLYREVRTYGFREAYYQAAREAGVVFVRYELPRKPRLEAGEGGLRVSVVEPVTGQPVELEADLVVLSVGLEAEAAGEVAARLGVKRNGDGFFQEEQPKMKPLDLGKAGLFVAGLAHSPRFVDEAVAQGQGAAMRAAAYLASGEEGERAESVWVNERLCSFCGLCVAACPYEARVMDYEARVAQVDYGLCQGCGVCAVVCPNKATQQKTFEPRQLMAALDVAFL